MFEFPIDAVKSHAALESLLTNIRRDFGDRASLSRINLRKNKDGVWIAESEIKVKISGTSDK